MLLGLFLMSLLRTADARGIPQTGAERGAPAEPVRRPPDYLHAVDAAILDFHAATLCTSEFHLGATALYTCGQSEMAEAYLLYAPQCPGFGVFEMYNGTCEDFPFPGGDAQIVESIAEDTARNVPFMQHLQVRLLNRLPGVSEYEYGVIPRHFFPAVGARAPLIVRAAELATVLLLMLVGVMVPIAVMGVF